MAQHHHPHHVTENEYGSGKKTLSAYVTGLVLCIILTLAAFGIVEKRMFSNAGLYVGLAALAIVQLFVQVACFLRLNASEEGRWNLMAFLFTLFVVAILVGGSLWIMINLNYNMM